MVVNMLMCFGIDAKIYRLLYAQGVPLGHIGTVVCISARGL